ncbi:MAG: SpoIIIAH-like family protein, partial [Oscillospiraceae bacterium]|nr:SpoIIIAH-like family protein [Oscillospiraceae bacterium]
MNMIIGKRQIILTALVLGLGIAVYLNWEYSKVSVDVPAQEAIQEHTPNYGEAQYVDAEAPEGEEVIAEDAMDDDAYFAEAQLSRQKARDEAVETLAVMLADAELDTDQRSELTMRATQLAQSIET